MLPVPSIVSFSAGRLRKVAVAALLGTTILTGAAGLPADAFAAPQAVSQELPGSFADLVERVTPAVVNVSTVQGNADAEQPRGLPGMPEFPPGSPFEEFFKQFQEQQRGARPSSRRNSRRWAPASSSMRRGFVVTNNHVIDGADEITVTLMTAPSCEAKLVGTRSEDRSGAAQGRGRQAPALSRVRRQRQGAGRRLGDRHRQSRSAWAAP